MAELDVGCIRGRRVRLGGRVELGAGDRRRIRRRIRRARGRRWPRAADRPHELDLGDRLAVRGVGRRDEAALDVEVVDREDVPEREREGA